LSKRVAAEEQRQIDDEREVLRKLVVDEREVIKSVFSIAAPSGKIIFQNFGELSDEKRILVLLLGKYFARRLGFTETAELGISGIAEELGRPKTALSGDVGNLIKDGLIEKLPDRTYRIAYNRMRDVFNKILPDRNQVGPRLGVPAKGMPSLFPTLPATDVSETFPGLKPPEHKRTRKRLPEKAEQTP